MDEEKYLILLEQAKSSERTQIKIKEFDEKPELEDFYRLIDCEFIELAYPDKKREKNLSSAQLALVVDEEFLITHQDLNINYLASFLRSPEGAAKPLPENIIFGNAVIIKIFADDDEFSYFTKEEAEAMAEKLEELNKVTPMIHIGQYLKRPF